MKRRALLGSLFSLGAGSLAGCLFTRRSDDPRNRANEMPGGNGTDRPSTTSTRTPDDSLSPISDGFRWAPAGDSPARRFTVGSRSAVTFPDAHRPHHVQILNDGDERREFSLRVTSATASFERTVSLASHRRVAIDLSEPGTYRLAVAADGDEPTRVRIPRESFDCNDSTTRVAVRADGRVEWTTESASASCRPPAVVNRSISVEGRSCGDAASEASVSFADQRVVVQGKLPVAESCGTARIRSVRYDSATDTLALVVAASLSTDQSACTDCGGAVVYRGAVRFERGYPGRVIVRHAVGGERATVATVERS